MGDDDRLIPLEPAEQALVDLLNRIDGENTDWLRGVVDRQGWPTRTLVGTTAPATPDYSRNMPIATRRSSAGALR